MQFVKDKSDNRKKNANCACGKANFFRKASFGLRVGTLVDLRRFDVGNSGIGFPPDTS